MSARTRAKRIVRRTIDLIALAIVIVAVVSIEALPAWLPFLLILTAGALAWLGRRVTVTSRRAEHAALIRIAKEAHRGHH